MSRSLGVSFEMVSFVGNITKLCILCIFALALAVSEIIAFLKFEFQKVSQGHRVQFSQWPFDGKWEIPQKTITHFAIALTVSEILTFLISDLQTYYKIT